MCEKLRLCCPLVVVKTRNESNIVHDKATQGGLILYKANNLSYFSTSVDSLYY